MANLQSLILVANVYYKAFLRVDWLKEILPGEHEVEDKANPLVYYTMFHQALDTFEDGLSNGTDPGSEGEEDSLDSKYSIQNLSNADDP